MAIDQPFATLNRASTDRLRGLAAKLTDADLLHPVSEDWTVAVALAHLAFWDRRVTLILEKSERDGKLFTPEIDVVVNDLLLPFWAAMPPREAARLALESAEALDRRLETFPPALLETLYAFNRRWVVAALHRGEHLDDIEAALKR
jgi:hypothetical protein